MHGTETGYLRAAAVEHTAGDIRAETVAAYGLESHTAFRSGHQIAAFGMESHVKPAAVSLRQTDVFAVIAERHKHIMFLQRLASETEIHLRTPVLALTLKSAIGQIAHILANEVFAAVAVLIAHCDIQVVAFPLEAALHPALHGKGGTHRQTFPEKIILTRILHKGGVGHKTVVAFGKHRIEREITLIHTIALHDLDTQVGMVVRVYQFHIQVLADVQGPVCGSIGHKSAETDGIATVIRRLVGHDMDFLLRIVIDLTSHAGQQGVDRHILSADRRDAAQNGQKQI